jgi:hypothetical protein
MRYKYLKKANMGTYKENKMEKELMFVYFKFGRKWFVLLGGVVPVS